MEGVRASNSTGATRAIASTFGILVGLAGIEHGYFEVLQGNARPDSLLITAIGPGQRFWEYGSETALTVLPTFLAAGVLAMAIGLLVTIWAAAFVDSKYGAGILLLLSVALFLVGGGFAPIFLTILAGATATRIGKPLIWWRAHLPAGIRGFLARLWPWSLVAFVLVFVVAVEIAIFGYPLVSFLGVETTFAVQSASAYVMLGLMLLCVPIGFAYDIQRA